VVIQQNGTALSAAAILRLIERADLADKTKLNEIGARVWCFIRCEEFGFWEFRSDYWEMHTKSGVDVDLNLEDIRRFTCSRDTLKDIRPTGWAFYLDNFGQIDGVPFFEFECSRGVQPEGRRIRSAACATEELAELHAIIQAIEYERRRGRLSLSRWLSP
jgi:hypothetical protein